MANQLKGKVAIVTGSTSGIGQGIAETFAREGASIMLNGLGDPAAIDAYRVWLEKETKVAVDYHAADMTKPDEIALMMKRAKAHLGGIDIVVNNAGIQHVAPVDEFPTDRWDAIIAINLTSAFHVTRLALPEMKRKKWGRVINIASAHGLVASPFKSAYVAAKHGLIGFTKTVALEVAELGITSNAICPGYVHTPLVDRQIDDQARVHNLPRDRVIKEVILAPQPTRQFIKIEDIAQLALYLTSNAAAQITGASLPIDGGWTAR
jgi:3-hydroxybutyrate dehydrogenase